MSKDPKSTYYDAGGLETLDIIRAKLTPEQYKGYLIGNLLRYTCRINHKGDFIRDAEKIGFYSRFMSDHLAEAKKPLTCSNLKQVIDEFLDKELAK